MEDAELKVGGFSLKGWHVAALLPILSGLSGGIYYGYDAISRFNGMEASVIEVLDATGRIQSVEQTLAQNNVSGLGAQLSQISTQMVNILEQQRTLMDLKSKIERAELITNGIDQKLQALQADIDSTWGAINALEKPL
tara:strand:+ start:3978 stop:4391 length:414 start_codon:yes stop_codon:yes gene_type:complete